MAELKFEIVKNYGVFSEGANGWNKELNLVSWNGAKPKLDIRSWSEDHTKMGKGITLSEDEAWELAQLIQEVLDKE